MESALNASPKLEDTKFLVVDDRNTIVFANWDVLVDYGPYFAITQQMMDEMHQGHFKEMELGQFRFLFAVEKQFFFLAVTTQPEGHLLALKLQALMQVIFCEVGLVSQFSYFSTELNQSNQKHVKRLVSAYCELLEQDQNFLVQAREYVDLNHSAEALKAALRGHNLYTHAYLLVGTKIVASAHQTPHQLSDEDLFVLLAHAKSVSQGDLLRLDDIDTCDTQQGLYHMEEEEDETDDRATSDIASVAMSTATDDHARMRIDEAIFLNTRELKRSSEHVRVLQRALTKIGFDVAANGSFTSETTKALERFQSSVSLPSNGQLDAHTLRRLRRAYRKIAHATPLGCFPLPPSPSRPHDPNTPTPTSTSTPTSTPTSTHTPTQPEDEDTQSLDTESELESMLSAGSRRTQASIFSSRFIDSPQHPSPHVATQHARARNPLVSRLLGPNSSSSPLSRHSKRHQEKFQGQSQNPPNDSPMSMSSGGQNGEMDTSVQEQPVLEQLSVTGQNGNDRETNENQPEANEQTDESRREPSEALPPASPRATTPPPPASSTLTPDDIEGHIFTHTLYLRDEPAPQHPNTLTRVQRSVYTSALGCGVSLIVVSEGRSEDEHEMKCVETVIAELNTQFAMRMLCLPMLVSKEQGHTIWSYPYLHLFPGLVHFIVVDRTANVCIAPRITPLHNSDVLSADDSVEYIRKKTWDAVHLGHLALRHGYTYFSAKLGLLQCSYSLSLLSPKQSAPICLRNLEPPQTPQTPHQQSPPTNTITPLVPSGDLSFYRYLNQKKIPQGSDLHVCEIFALYLGVVPSHNMALFNGKLARHVLQLRGNQVGFVNV